MLSIKKFSLMTVLCCSVGSLASASILTNNSFEADAQGVKAANGGGVTGWRIFAGGGNTGSYAFELVADAADGSNGLKITRSSQTGAGGGVDNFNSRAAITAGESYDVSFAAKDFNESPTDLDSRVQLEVRFSNGGGGAFQGGALQIYELTDSYQTFGLTGLVAPVGTDSLYIGLRPLGVGTSNLTGVIVDNVVVVPEPASLAMVALGTGLILFRRSGGQNSL